MNAVSAPSYGACATPAAALAAHEREGRGHAQPPLGSHAGHETPRRAPQQPGRDGGATAAPGARVRERQERGQVLVK